MAPLVLGAIFLGREATIIGLALVAMSGFKEFARATGLSDDWWMTVLPWALRFSFQHFGTFELSSP